ncbi:GNAT family N-acetyltransferase [Candidatus Accumulibacter vicinus]|uniref:Putative acetyltransferase n=1 Tax=Candidatus Accumulibacter vicinus TaxID=2954382 RepID=A0A084Y670_9PROT|nr:GNAT family N-acetyltransferase [Candidatus Accumulibacter vicinus]KFB70214.1 MAG: putative acetyltransferase [Candidatus Accumulibacter vicinus]
MHIRPATVNDSAILANLISESNKDVAALFGLNRENCPKHPSFCEAGWIESDIARGELYFIAELEAGPVGCVATEYPSPHIAYLNRLAVLPTHRRQGIGAALTEFVLQLARQHGVQSVSIGVIGEHVALQRWYQTFGFVAGELKQFEHLPFSVRYMAYVVSAA